MYEITPPGVCMGLAWTSHGGSTLYIETLKQRNRNNDKEDGGGSIEFTGKALLKTLLGLHCVLNLQIESKKRGKT